MAKGQKDIIMGAQSQSSREVEPLISAEDARQAYLEACQHLGQHSMAGKALRNLASWIDPQVASSLAPILTPPEETGHNLPPARPVSNLPRIAEVKSL